MLTISTAPPTLSATGTAAPAKIAGGDFVKLLDGLSVAPVADPLSASPPATVEVPSLPSVPTMVGKATSPAAIAVGAPLAEAVVDFTPAPPVPPETVEPDSAISLLPALPIKRQGLADDGKTLPRDEPDDDPSKDLIWLPTALVVPPPVPAAHVAALPSTRVTITPAAAPATVAEPADGIAATPIATVPAQAGAQLREAIAQSPPFPSWAPPSAGVAVTNEVPTMPAKDGAPLVRLPDAAKADVPVRLDTTATTAPQPAQPGPVSPAPTFPALVLPAGQVFAAAIAAAVQQRRDDRDPPEAHDPLAIATATLDRLHAPAVAAPPDVRQAALDLRQDNGLQGMIDHIETLRDGANAGDTRIRLVPDALGTVDVSVRRDGERVHVHFNAENQASARLIADAQPRLAELADARGVKLGQTSVDTGERGQQRQPQTAQPIRSTRPVAVSDSTEALDDLRVA